MPPKFTPRTISPSEDEDSSLEEVTPSRRQSSPVTIHPISLSRGGHPTSSLFSLRDRDSSPLIRLSSDEPSPETKVPPRSSLFSLRGGSGGTFVRRRLPSPVEEVKIVTPPRRRAVSPSRGQTPTTRLEKMNPVILRQVLDYIGLASRGSLPAISAALYNNIRGIELDLSTKKFTPLDLEAFFLQNPYVKISGLYLGMENNYGTLDFLPPYLGSVRKLHLSSERGGHFRFKGKIADPMELVTFCPKLENLTINGMGEGLGLTYISRCANLKRLHLDFFLGVTNLTALKNLDRLEILMLSRGKGVKSISLKGCVSLRELKLTYMMQLEEIIRPVDCEEVKIVEISHCTKINNLNFLKKCSNLETFRFSDVMERLVLDITPVLACKKLRRMYVDEVEFNKIYDLSDFNEMKDLTLNFIVGMDEVPVLPPNLTSFTLKQRRNVLGEITPIDISELSHCEHVTNMELMLMTSFDASILDACDALSSLKIQCLELHNMDNLLLLSNLDILSLHADRNFLRLPPMYDASLRELKLSCYDLADISGIVDCTSLTKVTIWSNDLDRVHYLASCPNLQEIDLSGCGRIISIQELTVLTNLRSLQLGGCGGLTDQEVRNFLENTASPGVIVVTPEGEEIGGGSVLEEVD